MHKKSSQRLLHFTICLNPIIWEIEWQYKFRLYSRYSEVELIFHSSVSIYLKGTFESNHLTDLSIKKLVTFLNLLKKNIFWSNETLLFRSQNLLIFLILPQNSSSVAATFVISEHNNHRFVCNNMQRGIEQLILGMH